VGVSVRILGNLKRHTFSF